MPKNKKREKIYFPFKGFIQRMVAMSVIQKTSKELNYRCEPVQLDHANKVSKMEKAFKLL